MIGFITTARHKAALAAKDALIDSLDKTAAFYKGRAEAAEREARRLNERLQALTPARDQGGRFVGKAVSNGRIIDPSHFPLPTPPETKA